MVDVMRCVPVVSLPKTVLADWIWVSEKPDAVM